MSTEPIIRIENVNKWYGQFQVLTDIYLDVAPGDFGLHACLGSGGNGDRVGENVCGNARIGRRIAALASWIPLVDFDIYGQWVEGLIAVRNGIEWVARCCR